MSCIDLLYMVFRRFLQNENQRNNGAVTLTWHLVLGRERDFAIIFKHVGHGHTTTWYKFWQQFKAFSIPIILYQFQKDPFCLIILYDILFYFIHVYIAPGQGETTLGDNFFDGSRKITGCMFQNNIFALWFNAHSFMILYMYIASAGADYQFGPKFGCQKEGLIT